MHTLTPVGEALKLPAMRLPNPPVFHHLEHLFAGARVARSLLAAATLLLAAPTANAANDWVNMATISPTSPLVQNRVCYTDGKDLACDGAAGLLTASGTLQITNLSANAIGANTVSGFTSVSGTQGSTVSSTYIYANQISGTQISGKFIGDGSQLTGVTAASSDRITSGTTSFIVISNTGFISLTQAGTNTGWFSPYTGLVALGVSTTGGISGTTGYFSGNVGIGPHAPTTALEVSGTISATNIQTSGTVRATSFVGDGSGLTGILGSNVSVTTGVSGSLIYRNEFGSLLGASNITISSTTGSIGIGTEAPGWIGNAGLYVSGNLAANSLNLNSGNMISWKSSLVNILGDWTNKYLSFSTSGTEAMRIVSNSYIGIGTSSPQTRLEVSGTISATRFIGDGSLLTNINAGALTGLSWYGLANIPAQVQAVSNGTPITLSGLTLTGTLSSTAAISASALSGTFVYANQLSATTASIGTLGVGSLAASGNLTGSPLVSTSQGGTISGTYIYANQISGTQIHGTFIGDGSQLTGVTAASSDRITSGTTSFIVISNTGFISLTQASTNTGWFDPTRGLVTLGVSATGTISATTGYFSNQVTIEGENGLLLRDSAPVSRYGSPLWMADIWYNSDNSNEEIFRIGSSNLIPAWLIRSSNGYPIILNTTSFSDVPGVAIGGWASADWPSTLSSTLFVKGHTIFTSWTSIGFGDSSRTAHTSLEVSGTISATNIQTSGTVRATYFVGDGSGLTNINAGALTGLSWYGLANIPTQVQAVSNGTPITLSGLTLSGTLSSTAAISASALSGTFVYANQLSATTASLGNIGTGAIAMSGNLTGAQLVSTSQGGTISGTYIYANQISGTQIRGTFIGDGSQLTGVTAASSDRITSGTTQMVAISNTGYISFTTNSITTGYFTPAGVLVANGISISTNQASFTTINLAHQAVGSTAGTLYKNNLPFLHTYAGAGTDGANLFLGEGAGNTTMATSGPSSEASYNTAVGKNALGSNGTGYGNTASGASTLSSNTTGFFNTASGKDALSFNTTGFGNTAIGVSALIYNTTGALNTGVGVSALAHNTTGSNNTVIGRRAGFGVSNSTVITDTTILGFQAGYGLTTSQQNTLLGSYAGDNITTGSNNIIIGYNTDTPAPTTNDYLNIGNAISGSLAAGGSISIAGLTATNNAAACNSTTAGGIRYNSGALQYCNGTTWITLGSAGAADWYGLSSIPSQVQAVSNGTVLTMNTLSGTFVYANQLSATTASLGNIGTGAIAMSGNLTGAQLISTSQGGTISGTYIYANQISGSTIHGTFIGDGSQLTGVTAASSDRITSGTTSFIVISNTGFISLTQAATNTGWFDPTRGLVTLGVSATGSISGTNSYFSGTVSSTAVSTTELAITSGGAFCSTATDIGKFGRISGRYGVCR